MSIMRKDANGNLVKIAGGLTKRENVRWFLCPRSEEDGIEYYTVPSGADEYYRDIESNTIFNLGFMEPNTTTTPKLRYKDKILSIRDYDSSDESISIGRLNGVYQMFTEKVNEDLCIYFCAATQITNDNDNNEIVVLNGLSKNYYNSGEYDTYVSNGNGTGTVTRKTGYLRLDGSEDWYSQLTNAANIYRMALANVVPNITSLQTVNNKFYVANIKSVTAAETYRGIEGVALEPGSESGKGNCLYYSPDFNTAESISDFKAWLSQNPIIIQYETETSYTEEVIENQPIHTLNQEGEWWLRKEWEKGLNVSPVTYTGSTGIYSNSYNFDASRLKVGQTYTISLKTKNTGAQIYRNEYVFESYFNVIADGNEHIATVTCIGNTQNVLFKNTKDNTGLMGTNGDAFYDIAIFEGAHAYPYKPYCGNIVRESDLNSIDSGGIQSVGLRLSGANSAQVILSADGTEVSRITVDDTTKVKKSGDTLTGALNFANNTANSVGDDCELGDNNSAGCIAIRGVNGDTGIVFVERGQDWATTSSNASSRAKISYNGSFNAEGRMYAHGFGTIYSQDYVDFYASGRNFGVSGLNGVVYYLNTFVTIDKLFPVGSRWIQFNGEATPAARFGGTWTEDTDYRDKFLVASSTTTGSGGSDTVALTSSNLPSHTHRYRVYNSTGSTGVGSIYGASNTNFISNGIFATNYETSRAYTSNAALIESTGSGTSFDNRPAYKTIIVWKRTA